MPQTADGIVARHCHDVEAGYSLAASVYEQWHWFQFWRQNEAPLVREWGSSLTPGLVLDAGSGTGVYRSDLRNAGHRVIAVDLSYEMLRIQQERYSGAMVVAADVRNLPLKSGSVDNILSTRVLSHIADPVHVFSEFARVSKRSSQFLLCDVHPEHRYSDMSIPVDGQKISIKTYKHPLVEIKRVIDSLSLELLQLREFHLNDLFWKPPRKNFENIYDEPSRPIFYICQIRNP
jgi:ubiquinone/menaquinone biosynthesis C-methylase UbiE